jgi:hypothetical protein
MIWTLLALAATAAATIIDCDPQSVFRPITLELQPATPVSGELVHLINKFENPGPVVTDGTVTTSITLNFVPFTPSVEPLCQNTACPIAVGAVDRSTESTWPSDIQGKIVSRSQWTGVNGESLLCVQITTSVGYAPTLRGFMNVSASSLTSLFRDEISKKRIQKRSVFKYPADNGTCPNHLLGKWYHQ